VTDAEIRAIGERFISSRRELLKANPFGLDPASVELGNRRWDYIDPLRMGLYVLAKNGNGMPNAVSAWTVDFDHIQKVCANPAAFADKREGSARMSDFGPAFSGAQPPPAYAGRLAEFEETFKQPPEPELSEATAAFLNVAVEEMPDFDASEAFSALFGGLWD
jgi:hypothetical protein